MGQRLLQRRLAATTSRIREIREELRIVEEQLDVLADEADDKSLRALVSETPAADFEWREAKVHADAMRRHRDGLVAELAGLQARVDELLDRMEPAP